LPLHHEHPRGIAYETDTHFVHMYGRNSGLWVISPGLTVTVRKTGALRDWIVSAFGATDVEDSTHDVGQTTDGVWRPGLYYAAEMLQGLGNSEVERRLAEQALRLLIQKLDEILVYIEPTTRGLDTFGHKTRELLILACTEVENGWTHYLKRAKATPVAGQNFTTRDYVKLDQPLFLQDFEISLPLYADIAPIKPYQGWDANRSTQSLSWYDAYNKTKHDRSEHFETATVRNCISAVTAALVLFCIRFSRKRRSQATALSGCGAA
jgi:hypothetical protein